MQPHPTLVRLARTLHARMGAGSRAETTIGEVAAADYLSEARHADEQRRIFSRLPQVVAVAGEVAAAGACVVAEVAGASLLLIRGRDGVLRGFRNACRHRATRLVTAPCTAKAIVCPYHGWTYDLAGELIHVPHAEAFGDRCDARGGLIPVPVAARHGLVWAGIEPFDLAALLAPIDDELAALAADRWHLYGRSSREVRGNWKLIIDAFLDGYHIRQLHRGSIYPFFADAWVEAEQAAPHIRAVVARRGLATCSQAALDTATLREVTTPSYLLFPNVIIIVHPDYLSVLACTPLAVDRTRFVHWMLIPQAPRSDAESAHWARSFALIDEGVFLAEDLRIVEAMQRGLASSGDEQVLFGWHEHASLWFHDAVAAALRG